MKSTFFDHSLLWLASIAVLIGYFTAPLGAMQETELKDESGKTIIKYVIEIPGGIAPAGTTDPAKQVGLILCFQEHDTATGNDLFPVRQSLWREPSTITFCLPLRLKAGNLDRKIMIPWKN
jgi:hypothetical protein